MSTVTHPKFITVSFEHLGFSCAEPPTPTLASRITKGLFATAFVFWWVFLFLFFFLWASTSYCYWWLSFNTDLQGPLTTMSWKVCLICHFTPTKNSQKTLTNLGHIRPIWSCVCFLRIRVLLLSLYSRLLSKGLRKPILKMKYYLCCSI